MLAGQDIFDLKKRAELGLMGYRGRITHRRLAIGRESLL
jgi:hypothetical protein